MKTSDRERELAENDRINRVVASVARPSLDSILEKDYEDSIAGFIGGEEGTPSPHKRLAMAGMHIPVLREFSFTERYYTQNCGISETFEWGECLSSRHFRLTEILVTPQSADHFSIDALVASGLLLIKHGRSARPLPMTFDPGVKKYVSFTNHSAVPRTFEITFKGVYID